MTPPIRIAGCQIEVDPEKKSPPTVHCYRDRERTVNPKLLEGLTCETEYRFFEWDGKQVHRWETICRPEVKTFRRLERGLNPRVIEELKQHLKNRKPLPQSAPQPEPRTQPKTIIFSDKDVIST